MPLQRSSSSSPGSPAAAVEPSSPSVLPASVIAVNPLLVVTPMRRLPVRSAGGRGWNVRLSTYAILRAAMQTSLARRERRRRNHTGARRPGGGAGGRIAVILPALPAWDVLRPRAWSPSAAPSRCTRRTARTSRSQAAPRRASTSTSRRSCTTERARSSWRRSDPRTAGSSSSPTSRTWCSTPRPAPKTRPSGRTPASTRRRSCRRCGTPSPATPRGASTITQQLVRAPELLPATTQHVDRKIKEIIQSVRLTQEFPGDAGKQAIITDYLNLNFYGNQSYGIAAAAQGYFGVTDLSKLTIAQAAILAGILQAPSAYDLVANAQQLDDGTLVVPADSPIVQRRNAILEDMRRNNQDGLLQGQVHRRRTPRRRVGAGRPPPGPTAEMIAPQFDLMVRQQLADLLCGQGTDPADCPAVDTGGYKVITTLDVTMQKSAEKWLKAYVFGPNQATLGGRHRLPRHPWASRPRPTTTTTPGSSARAPRSNVGLRNGNIHNGALIAVDYRTGQVLAYAGSAGFYEKTVKDPGKPGQDYFDPEYDVLSSGNGRQPGSSFKPINYLIGIQDGTMTAATLFMDVATDFGGGLHAPRRRRLRARPGPAARGAPVLAEHPGRQGRLDQRRRPRDAASRGLRAAVPGGQPTRACRSASARSRSIRPIWSRPTAPSPTAARWSSAT